MFPGPPSAAAAAGACFSLGSHYTPVALGLAALGAVLMRPAWEGAPGSTSVSSRAVVTAIDTELLLLQTVATEAASPALGIRIACLAVAGVALLNFVATAFVSEESHAWLRRLTRFLGPALMLAVVIVNDKLTVFQNVRCHRRPRIALPPSQKNSPEPREPPEPPEPPEP